MNIEDIYQKQIKIFKNNLSNEKSVNHAWLFSGLRGVGKFAVAKSLAAWLLGRENIADTAHPDLMIIDQETEIKVDQARKISSFLLHKPVGKIKCVLINNIHLMNNRFANALLKTLEEPASKAVIIIINHNLSSIPKTFLSRCQNLNFPPLSEAETLTLLVENEGLFFTKNPNVVAENSPSPVSSKKSSANRKSNNSSANNPPITADQARLYYKNISKSPRTIELFYENKGLDIYQKILIHLANKTPLPKLDFANKELIFAILSLLIQRILKHKSNLIEQEISDNEKEFLQKIAAKQSHENLQKLYEESQTLINQAKELYLDTEQLALSVMGRVC